MNRIDRLSAILIQLQSKKIVKAQEIANRFDISLRTVYRDIRALEDAGIPIGAEAGVGYFLNEDFHLPPVVFTQEEASAFLLAGKLVGELSDDRVSKSFDNALYKVKSVLKISDKEYIDSLESKISVFNNVSLVNKEFNLFLQEIQSALASKNMLQVEYHAYYNKKTTTRIIEPVSLCNYDMSWHLIAYCKLRGDYRDFRLDRIVQLSILEEKFQPENHISLNEYFERMTKEKSMYQIVLHMNKDLWEEIGSVKYWYGLIEEKESNDYYKMLFAHNDLHVFARWILTMGNQVEIVNNEKLKGIVKYMVSKLNQYYC